ICAIELALGVLGYFSGWKGIIILAGMTLLALAGRTWPRWIPVLSGGLAALLVLGIVWTVIKPSYREALSEGARSQNISLGLNEQIATLSHQISEVKSDSFANGFTQLLMRVSYTDYLTDVLKMVPSRIEYQNGRLWGEALQQFLTPRFLFPDKADLPSDSE